MNKLNLIGETIKRNDINTLVDISLSTMGIDISVDDRTAFKNIITKRPENSTLLVVLSHKSKHIQDDCDYYFQLIIRVFNK